ncbi:putative hippurate hydrolase [Lasiosphaeris hirsuta]|uniref:Hippurate hydrolase n=1 Tax=Lasiosphaeris hirsuta TaxID=260670 RepID=A0AA40E6H3_9PEZI|nr:putative hippurate hydrolase [Lasiosphaeris hirsuta]
MANLQGIVNRFRPNVAESLGFDEVIGQLGGHGLAGVLRNGPGPVVMIRADMDALPVKELTGLPYTSTKTQMDRFGVEYTVMHACGHDVHVACLMGAAQLLYAAREAWSGTLVCLLQPGEEDGAGARKMIRSGAALSACDCFDVRLFGKGGHGSSPRKCIYPVYAACSIVVRLQGIVSREVDPADYAVVTCVSLQTSKAINIVPDTVDMKVDVRSYGPAVRKCVVAAVKRVIRGESEASGLLKELQIVQTDDIPAIINDDRTVEKLERVFRQHFGESAVSEMARDTGSDDFSIFAEAQNISCAYWNIGGVDPAVWQEAKRNGTIDGLPGNHSAHFAPAVSPTIRTGIDALAVASLAYLVSNV